MKLEGDFQGAGKSICIQHQMRSRWLKCRLHIPQF